MNKAEQPARYAIVRADLPPGLQAAMLMHAVGTTPFNTLCDVDGGVTKVYVEDPPSMWALALHVRDEAHLLEVAGWLEKAKVPHHVYRDPDIGPEALAIGVEPTYERERVKKTLQRLPCFDFPPRASVAKQMPSSHGSAVGQTTGGSQTPG